MNMDYIPKKFDYIFVIYQKDVLTMPFGEMERILGELVQESKVCYNKKNEK